MVRTLALSTAVLMALGASGNAMERFNSGTGISIQLGPFAMHFRVILPPQIDIRPFDGPPQVAGPVQLPPVVVRPPLTSREALDPPPPMVQPLPQPQKVPLPKPRPVPKQQVEPVPQPQREAPVAESPS